MVNNNTGILPQEIRMHDMEKIYSKLRRTDYYDFGHGLSFKPPEKRLRIKEMIFS